MGTKGRFIKYNLKNAKTSEYEFEDSPETYVHDLYIDGDSNLWIASSDRLLKFNLIEGVYKYPPKLPMASRILSFAAHNEKLFIATISGGMFELNTKTNELKSYKSDNQNPTSLFENNIVSLFMSRENILWVGTFVKGLQSLDLNALKFGYEKNTAGGINCANDNAFVSGVINANDVKVITNDNNQLIILENDQLAYFSLILTTGQQR